MSIKLSSEARVFCHLSNIVFSFGHVSGIRPTIPSFGLGSGLLTAADPERSLPIDHQTAPIQAEMRNRLLALLSEPDWSLLAPHLDHVDMPRGFTLCDSGSIIDRVFFMTSGVGSIIVRSTEGLEVEGGIFGRDGVAPVDALLGSDQAAHRIVVQVEGEGWALPTHVLKAALDASASLRTLFLRYAQTLTVQATFTALSNAVHSVDERLARWLLMCDDRTDCGELHLTHEFLSIMLAVRRPSVTNSLHVLEGNGYIRAERGRITIRNRSALEAYAGDAYGQAEAEYARLIGELRPPQAAVRGE